MISRCPNHLKSHSNVFVLVQANRVLSSDVYDIYLFFFFLFVHGRDLLQWKLDDSNTNLCIVFFKIF